MYEKEGRKIMLIMGHPRCIIPAIQKFSGIRVLDFNCGIVGYANCGLLPVSLPISYYQDDRDFDIAYARYILENPVVFGNFFNIITDLHCGNSVFLISNTEDGRNVNLPESLLKFIQQRYGYNGCICNEAEDLCYAKESSFSIPGLYQYDRDREIYLTKLFS